MHHVFKHVKVSVCFYIFILNFVLIRGSRGPVCFEPSQICLALHAFPCVGFWEPRVETAVWQALKQTSPRSEKVGEINRMF